MENISAEVYEQIKAQILDEIQSRKEGNAGARGVFASVRAYIPQLENKYGSGYDERYRCISHNVYLTFEAVKRAVLAAYGYKTTRQAWASGHSRECNEMAERILEVMLIDKEDKNVHIDGIS